MLKAPRLRKGDLIALVAPASTPSSSEKIDGAVRYLEGRGYSVAVGKHVLDVHGYLAGTDQDRLEDLNGFIRDKRVRAIIALRGGYGTPRLLDRLAYDALKKDPKIIVGYSDITGLQLAVYKRSGLVTFSGPMAAVEMWKEIDPYTEETFWRLVGSADPPGPLPMPKGVSLRKLRGGTGTGPMLGGNFSLLMSMMGTPYLPDLAASVLVLEDIDEAPHRVDRMLTSLRLAGVLEKASAVLFGEFTDCVASDTSKPHLTVEQLQQEFSASAGGPVLAGVPYGHVPRKLTVPIGAPCRVDGDRGVIEVTEGVVS